MTILENPFEKFLPHVAWLETLSPETLDQVYGAMKAASASWERGRVRATARATCKHCAQPIWRIGESKWRHADPDESRGCHAASYRTGVGWDDSVVRGTVATVDRKLPHDA